jgi:hypothetical protein
MKLFFNNFNRAKQKLKLLTKKGKAVIFVFLGFFFALSVMSVFAVSASFEKGNIDSENKFAWNENIGWVNFGNSGSTVEVSDTNLSGYAWSENAGWIALSCSNNNSCTTSNFEVKNDSEGNLSGYAWGENIGWLNFAPANGGVKVGNDGNFSGYAWGENIGWLIFGCETTSSCSTASWRLETDWQPASVRDEAEAQNEELKISSIKAVATADSVTLEWKTSLRANSHVRWGTDQDLKKEINEDRKERSHRIVIRDLSPETKYYFSLKSTGINGVNDSTRIRFVSTKKRLSSALGGIFGGSSNKESAQEDMEEVKVTVSDKNSQEETKEVEEEKIKEDVAKEIKEEPKEIPKEEPREITKEESVVPLAPVGEIIKNVETGEPFFTKISKPFKFVGQKIGGYFSILAKGVAKSAMAVYRGLFVGQKKIAGSFNDLRLGGEKARKQFFTTEIFKKNGVKTLAEVKFQLLDKEENPIAKTPATLASRPQTSLSDENGVIAFRDVEIGDHTLTFAHQGEDFKKKVAIANTLTEEGKVRMEVVQVEAAKEKVAVWMWVFAIIMVLAVAVAVAIFFAVKYYKLKNEKSSKIVGS